MSNFAQIPSGLVDPLSCNKTKCKIDTAANIKGNKKCITKKRFKVGLSTEKPPHNQDTILLPTIGKAPRRLVITVAAHKLICPQGKT